MQNMYKNTSKFSSIVYLQIIVTFSEHNLKSLNKILIMLKNATIFK